MYVEAYKTSVKLNVKSKVVFFSRYAFFPYVYHRSLRAVFLIKLRWLKNRSIYDKVGKYQTPKKSLDQN